MRYIEANAFLCTLLPDENEYNPLGFYMILLRLLRTSFLCHTTDRHSSPC
jgi:hypothetical protein